MSAGELILYTTEDGLAKIQMRAVDGTVWLTQDEIANLFQKSRTTIVEHIQNIYTEGELNEVSVCRNFRRTAEDGKTYEVQHYNLDLVLSVGYRVKSLRGIQFRQWATTSLKEFLLKGFLLDDERLKEPGGLDYFDELLARIKEIRASEKRFYQKVRDLYALSTDYDPKSEQAKLFFQSAQNKMLWAVTGKTAPELIATRCNTALPNMGLTSWKGVKVKKQDIVTSKNYLAKDEITNLNRLVTMFLDYAEDQTVQRKLMYMNDWSANIDGFLTFNNRKVLTHAGSISHETAEQIANQNYEIFDTNRKLHEFELAEKEALEELMQIESTLIND